MTNDPATQPPQAHVVQTARRLLELHRQMPEPGEAFCWRCMKRWSCPDARWSAQILRLANSPVAELDAVFDRVERERGDTGLPFKVDIGDGSGDEDVSYGLVVGLGHAKRSSLMWIGPPRGGMGVEVGVPAWDGEAIAFEYGGLPTEETAETLRVTPATAREAARQYVSTGERPTCVAWE